MNSISVIPVELRLTVLFIIGLCAGSAINWAIYSLAWYARPISPWARPHPEAPRRSIWDRLPVIGWPGLRRESSLHGPNFWLRPMILELFCGFGLAWLYWWEVVSGGLLVPGLPKPFPPDIQILLHSQFIAHALLAALMLAASMIDVDEKTIPDSITVTGTVLGLLLAAILPTSALPTPEIISIPDGGGLAVKFNNLHLASPNPWPEPLCGFPNSSSLVIALCCWFGWCIALLPRVWRLRHGLRRALVLCWARIVKEPISFRILCLALAGLPIIGIVWYHGGDRWQALLSALVGMAVSGGLVWLVRIVGSWALNREAMGFGDVTLMAMIGAFLGWQPCLIIFFLAPFAGLAIALLRLILFRDKEIPYGPFLCLATVVLILYWEKLWRHTEAAFSLGWFIAVLLVGCLALMALMLGCWRMILNLFPKT